MEETMPRIIEGFTQVEYLTVFYTIIFGVIATEYFSGWGSMLRHRNTIKIFWPHLIWSIFAFLTFIQNWFGIWPRVRYINDNILYFMYGLIPMFLFYLMTVVMFPNLKFITQVDFKEHYYKNSRALFILFGIYLLTTIVSSFVYKDVGDVTMQNIIRCIGVLLAFSGAYFHRIIWIHLVFLAIGIGGLLKFIFVIPK